MAHGFSNRVWCSTATTGTGNVAIGTAKPAHCTPAQALTPAGSDRTWLLEEGNDFELFVGTYNGGVVQRGTLILSQIGGTTGTSTRMTLAGTATIREVAAAEDLFTTRDPAGARSILSVREQLVAGRSYYVRSDGSDSNNGLANTSGGAFLTLQKAMNVAASLDLGVYDVTVYVAPGTYAGLGLQTTVGAGTVWFIGDETTQSNCVIDGSSGASSGGRAIYGGNANGNFYIAGFQLKGAGTQDVYTNAGAVWVRNCEFAGTSNYRVYQGAGPGGILYILGNNTKISGGGIGMFLADTCGNLSITNTTYTVTANVTFTSAFATARFLGCISCTGCTFNLGSFTVTGNRYLASSNGAIIGAGGGANYFPGSSPGSTSTGGQYI